ncbi:MAG: hypothetical protein MHM6MM_005952 [Cercozoa sp. M6MM]
MLRVTPLTGAGEHEPYCFLVRIGPFRLLLDCGWDHRLNENSEYVAALKKLEPVDAILITHGTMRHCGGLPLLWRHVEWRCPVYMTVPAWRLGSLLMYDLVETIQSATGDFPHFCIDDVDDAFDRCTRVKYLQEVYLEKPLAARKIQQIRTQKQLGFREEGDEMSDSESENENEEEDEDKEVTPTHEPVDASNLVNALTDTDEAIAQSASGEHARIVLTARNAGHSLGGAVWTVSSDFGDVVCALDWNHRREHCLDAATLVQQTFARRPALLLTDTFGEYPIKMAERDEKLHATVVDTLRNGGNVLIPCDVGGRSFELLQVLDALFARVPNLPTACALVYLSPTSEHTISAARTMQEYAHQQQQQQQQSQQQTTTQSDDVFALTHVQCCRTVQEAQDITKPKVIVASDADLMSHSASAALLSVVATHAPSKLLFVQRSVAHSVAGQLQMRKDVIPVPRATKKVLHGAERRSRLAHFRRVLAREYEKRRAQALAQQRLERGDVEFAQSENASAMSDAAALEGADKADLAGNAMQDDEDEEVEDERDDFEKDFESESDVEDGVTLRVHEETFGKPLSDGLFANAAWLAVRDKEEEEDDEKLQMEAAQRALDARAGLLSQEEFVKARMRGKKAIKCDIKREFVRVQCEVVFVPGFEGRVDEVNLRQVLTRVQPRRLMLVGNTDLVRQRIRQWATQNTSDRVFVPNNGDSVEGTFVRRVERVLLPHDVASKLRWVPSQSLELAQVRVELGDAIVADHLDDAVGEMPVLHTAHMAPDNLHDVRTLMVGDMGMVDLHRRLVDAGFANARFEEGALVIPPRGKKDGVQLKVVRVSPEHLSLQGALSPDFLRVRRLLRQSHRLL